MSEIVLRESEATLLKNRRVGLILAALAVLYIGAVIAFIIVY
jgi:hypothetical protein